MKIVFENTKTGRIARYEPELAAAIFLELRGGGWTVEQTALAMEDQRAVREGENITVGNVDIYTED